MPGALRSPEPLRISQIAGQGDPARRASQRLLLQGLEEDAQGRARAALGQYERALQVDPTNPFAYLALARHEVEWGSPHRALEVLAQAETLLATDADSLRVEAHLVGLRGASLAALGRSAEAAALLARARSLAPAVWADGRLDAAELR
jgi:tetratricopeptide (TPR) repeat protein